MEDTGEVSGQAQLVAKIGRRSSVIWDHFGFEEKDEDQKIIICRICRRVVSAPFANTSNLFTHLKVNHRAIHDDLVKKKLKIDQANVASTSKTTQSSIQGTLYNATLYATNSARHKALTESIGYFLAKDMQAINTVEGEGFKKMIRELDKRYALPSRHYFTRNVLPGMYENCREKVSKEVLEADHFAATTDLWSSRTSEPYISLTVHFIDNELNLKVKCLQF